MLDQMANNAKIVRSISNDIGIEKTEDFIDVCLSLENLIDIHAPFKARPLELSPQEKERLEFEQVTKIDSKTYMDRYVNPKDYLEKQQQKILDEAKHQKMFPSDPEQNILGFLIQYAPITTWQRAILKIIMEEAYYFAPQGQTKILNEGWATYWHSKMMTNLYRLDSSEIIDYLSLIHI